MKKILCLVLAAVLMSAFIVYLQFGPAHKRLSPDSSLTQTIASMKNVVIYEGLPHPRWEPNLLEREAKSKQTVTIGDFLFYATPLHPNANDLDVIISSLQNPNLYEAWVGPKACGGFHPDFAVTWQNGLGQLTAQLCYGGEEIKIDGPGYHAYLDLAKNEELEAALKKNAVNRPAGVTRNERCGMPPMHFSMRSRLVTPGGLWEQVNPRLRSPRPARYAPATDDIEVRFETRGCPCGGALTQWDADCADEERCGS